MNNNDVIKEIRLKSKKLSLTFKRQNYYINGVTVLQNCILMSAWENILNGYLEKVIS
jgi:hypothetical protein